MGRRRHDDPSVAGLVLVDKPAGMSSHAVVGAARRALGVHRVGHSGTLDPAATGLLLVGVGWVTRVLRFTGLLPKTYVGTVRFGTATSTLDAEGEVVRRADCDVDAVRLDAAVAALVGDSLQVPPMVSAIKVDGEKLLAKARRGEDVERAPRPITVYGARVRSFTPGPGGGDAEVEFRVSAGTYIRVLAEDLGTALGGAAHLAALRRSAIGPHAVTEAATLEALAGAGRTLLLPPAAAVAGLTQLVVDAATADDVVHGRFKPRLDGDAPVAVLDADGRLLAVMEPPDAEHAGGRWRAGCVAPPLTQTIPDGLPES